MTDPGFRPAARLRLLLLSISLVAVAGGAFLAWRWFDCLPAGLEAQYVGGERCIQCHQQQHDLWKNSHHDLAMEPATPQTVLGDFNDRSVELDGQSSRFFQRDGKYFATTPGREGKSETFEVKYTFGVHPLQQYLAEFPGGKFQALPIAWDVDKKRWFHLYEGENLRPDEWLYWTNGAMNWNHQCAECHSTNLQKNYDPKTDSYKTTWTDVDVNCESCHGPGGIHLQVVDRGRWFGDRRYGTGLAKLKGGDGKAQLDACGACHSRRQTGPPGFRPGDALLDHYDPELLDTPAFYPDGQIHDEDFEYGSFQLSLMHQKGIRCTDCHDPHSCRTKAVGNALCIRCHQAGKYDAPSHHFHQAGSTGAQCTACHMPTTTYMKVDPRHDHSFRVPRPDLTLALGIPNACNRCHADKSADWAKDKTVAWYGVKPRPTRQDFALAVAHGREARAPAETPLQRLTRDQELPGYLRAGALAVLRNYRSPPTAELARTSLTDPQAVVRLQAVRWHGVEDLASPERTKSLVDALAERLNDASDMVRAEAARVLAPIARSELSKDQKEAYAKARTLYVSGLENRRDTPDGPYNLAQLYADEGDLRAAAAAYQEALAREPNFHAARFNLALLYYRAGQTKDAKTVFEQVLQRAGRDARLPDAAASRWNRGLLGQTHYYLGLLLAEDPSSIEAATANLQKAVELAPDLDRAWYNLGLALQHLGKAQEARTALEGAVARRPDEPDYLYALSVLDAQEKRFDDCRRRLEKLLSVHPAYSPAIQLLQKISVP